MKKIDRDGTIVIAGAEGFIGGHLANDLWAENYTKVRCIHIEPLDDMVKEPAAY